MIVAGVDPGVQGAIAVVDNGSGAVLALFDMPTRKQTINGKERTLVDPVGVANLFRFLVFLGVEFVAIEGQMAPLKDSGAALQTSGRAHGYLIMAAVMLGIPYHIIPPATWKAALKPGNELSSILAKADELFPGNRSRWYTPRGKIRDGCCEAAMIGLYGGRIYASVTAADAKPDVFAAAATAAATAEAAAHERSVAHRSGTDQDVFRLSARRGRAAGRKGKVRTA